MTLPVFLLICVGTNFLALLAYALDKIAAVRGERRTSEASLLGLTILGGFGALAATHLFRHKTRKQPFRGHADILAGLHIIAVAFIATLLF